MLPKFMILFYRCIFSLKQRNSSAEYSPAETNHPPSPRYQNNSRSQYDVSVVFYLNFSLVFQNFSIKSVF